MWLLDNGLWLDDGVWDDTDFWQDYPVASATLNVVEASDTASFAGTVTVLAVSGALATVEAADAAAFFGNAFVDVSGSLATVEYPDMARLTVDTMTPPGQLNFGRRVYVPRKVLTWPRRSLP